MSGLMNLVLTVQVICAIGIIVLVLLQQGKGADMGAAFGSGSVFGSTGSANFLSRVTAILAAIFFVATLGLSWIATKNRVPEGAGSVMQGSPEVPSAAPSSVPAPSAPNAPGGASVPGVPTGSGVKK